MTCFYFLDTDDLTVTTGHSSFADVINHLLSQISNVILTHSSNNSNRFILGSYEQLGDDKIY